MKSKSRGSAQTFTVTMNPDQMKFVASRIKSARVSRSKYFQSLVDYDLAQNVLPKALTNFIS
jgi:hypothetical protein